LTKNHNDAKGDAALEIAEDIRGSTLEAWDVLVEDFTAKYHRLYQAVLQDFTRLLRSAIDRTPSVSGFGLGDEDADVKDDEEGKSECGDASSTRDHLPYLRDRRS
jgi:hypothetical protein